ncbi:MAG: hypothetical protein ACP5PS_09900 [Bacteroidales bacterium]
MKVVIGIHGLDNKPEKTILVQWWQKAMEEGLKRIGSEEMMPAFELVYWADITYSRPLDMEDPYFMDDVYTRSPDIVDYPGIQLLTTSFLSKGLQKAWRWVRGSRFSDRTFEWLDPLVRRYFQEVDIYLFNSDPHKRNRIRNRLLEALWRHRRDEVLLIGHSMGSVIAYDVLLSMSDDMAIPTLVTMGSPLGFPYIAEKLAKAHALEITNPVKLPTPAAITRQWYNFFDATDIISLQHRLIDTYTPNTHGVAPIDRQVVNDYVNRGKRNPHNIFGYLRAKEFSQLLDAFISQPLVSASRQNRWQSIIKAINPFAKSNDR